MGLIISAPVPLSRTLISFDKSELPFIPVTKKPEDGEVGTFYEASAFLVLRVAEFAVNATGVVRMAVTRLAGPIPDVEALTPETLSTSTTIGNVTYDIQPDNIILRVPVGDLLYFPPMDDGTANNGTRNLRGRSKSREEWDRSLEENSDRIIFLLEVVDAPENAAVYTYASAFFSSELLDGSLAATIEVQAIKTSNPAGGPSKSELEPLPIVPDDQ